MHPTIDVLAIFIGGLFLGIGLTLWLRRAASVPAAVTSAADGQGTTQGEDAAAESPDTATAGQDAASPAPAQPVDGPDEPPRDRLFRLQRELESDTDDLQHFDDLRKRAQFAEGVSLLAGPAFEADAVLELLQGDNFGLASMIFVALRQRADIPPARALAATRDPGRYPVWYLLDYLRNLEDAATLPQFLPLLRSWWLDAPPLRQRVREYLQWAESHRPGASAGTSAMAIGDMEDYELEQLTDAMKSLQMPILAPFLAQCAEESARRRERRALGGVGRLRSAEDLDDDGRIVSAPHQDAQLALLHDALHAVPALSLLVVGEHGTGKSVLVDRLLGRLHGEGWLVFEASAMEVLAGQKYIGELEERVREMLATLDRPKAVWRVQDFFDLLQKGSHQQDPRGILDLLLPAMERGRLRMVGELLPTQLAQLQIARPALRHLVKTVRIADAAPAEMDDLLARWSAARTASSGRTTADERTLAEARRLGAQYFPEQHEPGRTLRLLEDALRHARESDPPALPLDADALLKAIARRSGLPLDVIDDRKSLDLEALRRFFRRRVIGQDEAVDCLIDRIAMLKAGLVDASRPVGVFLFAGPTGTGKTELAKALGELLFGSGERLLRLDMSEYQSEDSAWRLTDVAHDGSTRSLVARIREQPFSVVLLDEFEKAHPKVWDLFLQVFDDGRLSDRSGNVADFRHSIIILTSNAGSTLGRSAGPGFTAVAGGWSRSTVEKALFETFRREFLNRLDRIVLFNPLDRGLMREILHKELQRAMTRRGLRNRDWAVEWEPSAIEFLLDRGFTPDLGARPLRRAIEQHLLSPLARSIVEHRTPDGDQFLFVRSAGDRLDVDFVDPDASGTDPAHIPAATHGDLRERIFSPDTAPATIAGLQAAFDTLAGRLASSVWQLARDADFATMSEPDFWSRPNRAETLDRIERRNRIESALEGAERLVTRLAGDGADAAFAGRTAQTLWLIGLAVDAVTDARPQDALLALAASDSELRRDPARTRLWWQQTLAMYMTWAERRNMRVEVIEQDADACRARLAISGFGAFDLLQPEHGLHVFEHEADTDGPRRTSLAVRVAADPPGRPRPDLLRAEDDMRICRRYRADPSPLVRDSVRGWRTGRLDRVLAGDFDIIASEPAS